MPFSCPLSAVFPADLKQAVADKHLTRQKHPDADLYILNYSPAIQYERLWYPATYWGRGLIVDADYNIIHAAFPKIFNLQEYSQSEQKELQVQSFTAYDKLDGSLGILYWYGGKPYLATRGSFTSQQALKGSQMLHDLLSSNKHLRNYVEPGYTYLFEIIYPGNRIVVEYPEEKLVLLAVKQGEQDFPLPEGVETPQTYEGDLLTLLEECKKDKSTAAEGFMLKFDGLRVKLKYDSYVALHATLTNTSSKTIWEALREGRDLSALLADTPDEFYTWFRQTESSLKEKYQTILETAQHALQQIVSELGLEASRKALAQRIVQTPYPAISFALLDGKDPCQAIWRMIEPEYSKPFTDGAEI